jgi:O-antigen/teichoic acid export membrane protein
MSTELKKLARHSLIYGIGSSLGAVGSFLLIPLYTHSLSTEDYGALELLYSVCGVLTLITFMGVRQAYIRFYFDRKEDERWRETVTGSTLVFVMMACAVVLTVFLVFRDWLLEHLFQGHITDIVLLLAIAWIPLEMLLDTGLTFFQIQMRSTAFVVLNAMHSVLFITANLFLVYWLKWSVAGVFTAQIIATGLLSAAVLVYLMRTTRLRVSFPLIRQMMKFGIPFLPTALFMYVIKNVDRYSLGLTVSLEQLGVYALAAKVGLMGMLLCMDPFQKVWSPFLFDNYSKPNGDALVGRAVTLFAAMACFVAVGLAVVSPIALPWVTGQQFQAAFPLIPLTALATVFYGLSNIADAGILISKKTQYKPIIFGVASVVAVVANFALVPPFGVWGAAVASVISMASLVGVTLHYGNRFYRLPVDWRSIAMVFIGAIGTYLVCNLIYLQFDGNLVGQAGSLLALLSFPLLLWITGFFTLEELKGMQLLVAKLR